MADNQTPNYNFTLPEVDGSDDTWGDKLNQNWTDADSALDSLSASINAVEGRTIAAGSGLTGGGSLNGNVTITMGTPGSLGGNTTNRTTSSTHTHEIYSTSLRTNSSTTSLLEAKAMNDHRTSGDHDGRYAQLAGGAAANFTSMPQVGGDPIVESGSNSDGEWTRWADGTQKCSKRALHTGVTPNADSQASGLYRYKSALGWAPYPKAFTAIPTVGASASKSNNGRVFSIWGGQASSSRWPSEVGSCEINATAEAGDITINLFATGRWK